MAQMMESTAAQATTIQSAAAPAETVGENLHHALESAVQAVGAQAAIWQLKFARTSALTCYALMAVSAVLALAVYGFILLDRAFALALLSLHGEPWLPALVRGGLYFGLALIALGIGWHTAVGYGSAPSHTAASKD